MASFLERAYNIIWNEYDPRTKDWLLVSGPGPLITILVAYVYFCTLAGPRFMKNKPAYSLRTTLIVYNFIQVLLSVYLVYEALMAGWLYEYSYTCQPVDYSDNPSALRMARAVHLYYLCKLIELLDTVFFILKKNQRQVTFLHLYHHASMPLVAWIGVRYVAGGHPTFLGSLNSFVHIIMYAYYMATAIDPEMRKNCWWKKYLTGLQIVQFFIIGLHSAQMLFTDCNFPKVLSFLIMVDSGVFVYLFGSFYIKTYIRSKKSCTQNGSTLCNGYATEKLD